MSRKRILVLSHSTQTGGAELALKSLIESTSEKIEWGVVYPSHIKKLGLEINGVSKKYFLSLPWWCYEKNDTPMFDRNRLFKNIKKLESISKNYDILLTNTITVPWLSLVASNLNKPHVWYIHEYGNVDHDLKFILGYDESLKFINQTSDVVITISENLRDHLSKNVDTNKINILHQAIDLQEYSNIAIKDIPKDLKDVSIGMYAAIKPSKGQHLLIEALQAIESSGKKPPKAIIRGPVADKEYYAKLKSISIDKSYIDLKAEIIVPSSFLKNIDVVFVGSKVEALGRATIEALAAGKVIIGSNTGATKYLLKNKGILFNLDSKADLLDKIKSLGKLEKTLDREKNRIEIGNIYNHQNQANEFVEMVNNFTYKNKTRCDTHDLLYKYPRTPLLNRVLLRLNKLV